MLGYESIKKIVVRYNYNKEINDSYHDDTNESNTTKYIDISYVLDSDIDMDFPLLALHEMLRKMREDSNLGLPNSVIITLDIKLDENRITRTDEKIIRRVMVKKLDKPFWINDESIIIADLANFLYNLQYFVNQYEAHENIMNQGISYLQEYK